MYCTSCGNRMLDQDRFCAACGKPATMIAGSYQAPAKVLERDMFRNKLGGVCAGFATYLSMDVTLFRLLFVLATLATGMPLPFYLLAWAIMPRNDYRPMTASQQVGV